ncbi:MAG: ChbG/HpnK family deacetylase, partial [Myxococcaceae bacterium]
MSAGVRRLIINADDLGYDPAVSEGIVLAIRSGVVTS